MTPPSVFLPPETIDEYRVLRRLGQGAMGLVYLGHDTLLDRPVAIKFAAAVTPDPVTRERFLVEARAIARLHHEHVVGIYRAGLLGGRPYIVSELIEGQSLSRLELPLALAEVVRIGLGLGRALGAAHRRGVLHRDIKPANVMLTPEGVVKLLDFGLAKLGTAEAPGHMQPLPGSEAPRHAPLATADAPRALSQLDPAVSGMEATVTGQPGAAEPVQAGGFGREGEPAGAAVLTQAGTLLGTPRYMAPEIWRGEPASVQSDLYSLGVLLYELAMGRPPLVAATLGELREAVLAARVVPLALPIQRRARPPEPADAPPATLEAPDLAAGLSAIVERCLQHAPHDRFASCAALCAGLEALGSDPRPGREVEAVAHAASGATDNPYRGLHPFEGEHRALFFGREQEARAILDLLRSESLVVVTGDSGAGKSSLCRAGVLPLVEDGALGMGLTWKTARLTPGRQPSLALAVALAPLLGWPEERLIQGIGDEEPTALLRAIRQALGPGRGLVLFIDQMEELVTQCLPAEATRLGEVLGGLDAGLPGLRLLVSVRGDFLTRLAVATGLSERLLRVPYLLGPMSAAALARVITEPARRQGVTFESQPLVDMLVETTERAAGGLPLLQFALGELWQRRDRERRSIPAAALQAIGGVSGALVRHADGVLAQLPAREREIARRLCVALVTGAGTRARRPAAELFSSDPLDATVAEALVRGRLLIAHDSHKGQASAGQAGGAANAAETSYELAHEALIEGWGTLKEWLTAAGEQRLVAQRVEAAATEWMRLGKAPDALWRAGQLKEVADPAAMPLSAQGTAFMAASRRSLRRQRSGRIFAWTALPLAALCIYGGVALRQRRQLNAQVMARLTQAETLAAEAERRNATGERLRVMAWNHFRGGAVKQGEDVWAAAHTEAEAVHTIRTRIDGLLESALWLDPQRSDVRQRFGEALYVHALLAERDHRREPQGNLLGSLANFDVAGRFAARWRAPGRLTLTTEPPGAMVRIGRYQETGGQRPLVDIRTLGKTPLAHPTELAPGSYLLMLEAPGRAAVRYPFIVGREERLSVRIALPAQATLPAGFIYVPPGRFLYGAADEETFRLTALPGIQPLHEIVTGAYLIQRTETRFAEWIEFLRALPVSERSRHWPRERSFRGMLALSETSSGHLTLHLQLVPGGPIHVLAPGQKLLYPKRGRRAALDWLKLPVAAISYADAKAYLGWLDRSGRVPGARLCTEYEWERAARGADDRLYPGGDRLLADDADVDITYARDTDSFGPDEVGTHPGGESPFGVYDMAGNVWEWVESVVAPNEVVYRGGGWYEGVFSSRSANRQLAEPSLHDPVIGLRVCAPAPQTR